MELFEYLKNRSGIILLVILSCLSLFFIGLLPMRIVFFSGRDMMVIGFYYLFVSFFLWKIGLFITRILFNFFSKLFKTSKLDVKTVMRVSLLINIIGAYSFPIAGVIYEINEQIHNISVPNSYDPDFSIIDLTFNPDGSCNYNLLIHSNGDKITNNSEIHFILSFRINEEERDDINLCRTDFRRYMDIRPGENYLIGTTAAPTRFKLIKEKLLVKNAKLLASGYIKIENVRIPYEIQLNEGYRSKVFNNIDIWFQRT
ncbi:hypothetical protein HOD20_04460 [archaeon]|jgi:hypothetical protein|nr:hypothetical protein [archaeon]MBT4351758.1 hypothetical protein [archaeon]MBT4647863.1 hypothetical protein [archaeon]MBT6821064.1 hypothetical protein [archaeon]MBT7392017.1 hypothetical protein [archaeon]